MQINPEADKRTDYFPSIQTVSGITLTEGYAYENEGMKFIALRFNLGTGISARTKIANLPNGVRPKSTTIRLVANAGQTYGSYQDAVATCFIGQNGDIYVGDYTSATIQEVNVVGSYI